MPSLVRPVVVEYRLQSGKRCPKGTPGAVKHRRKAAKWYAQGIPGYPAKKRFPLASDRRAAERLLAELCRRAERGHAGLPHEPAAPGLDSLLDEFRQARLTRAGGKHVAEVVRDARLLLDRLGTTIAHDLTAPGLPAKVEAVVWQLTRPPDALAFATAAKHGKHLRQFTRWLWRKRGVLDRDPLAGLDLPSERPAAPRRHLTPDELARLLATAAASPDHHFYLSGEDRAVVYLLAAATGFRAGELARLTPERFALTADPPTVRPVPAGDRSKTREAKPQPLPGPVADRLRSYLRGRSPAAPVWPSSWSRNAADMLRADLLAAGIPEHTAEGQVVFHSLRHTYTTLVAEVAPVKVAQELARHSTPLLTIGRYAHATDAAKVAAVNRMALPAPVAPRVAPECAQNGHGSDTVRARGKRKRK